MNDILEEIEKPNNKKRIFLMRYLIFAGIAIIVFGFLYGISSIEIPDQDPKPELYKQHDNNSSFAYNISILGFIILMLGIVGGVVRKIIQFLKIKFL
ncbi:MAG: hypothetical protein IPQ19_09595 [Bacteroidetes bacterium]|nr:hypothetical protein [Bacteroidota bacterium]